jgi:hypothetical protein
MVTWGVHTDRAAEYEAEVEQGRCLVVVTGTPDQVALGQRVLESAGASDVRLHATSADTRETDIP